jgi:large conductance mechanosensitive channel
MMSDQNQQAVPTSPTRPVEAVTRAAADNAAGFRHFLSKSNAIALAIGIIIGGATMSLVTSIVENLINPILGVLLQNVDLSDIKIPLGPGNDLKIGAFLGSLINFVIIMFVAYQLARIFAKDLVAPK